MTRIQSKSVGKLCESTSERMANKRESSYNKMQTECDKSEAKATGDEKLKERMDKEMCKKC